MKPKEHDIDQSDQPQRRHVGVGEQAPRLATTGSRSVFDLAGPAATPAEPAVKRGGNFKRLPDLDVKTLRPVVRAKPPKPMPPSRKGTQYAAVFEMLKPGEMHELDSIYMAAIRRVMSAHHKQGPKRFSMRTLDGGKFGLWRDK